MSPDFIPSRSAALARLKTFAPKAGRSYATRRNYDLGSGNHDDVSLLSPYLRCRLLTEEEVVQTVLGQHTYAAAEKFVQEVYWRTYWKGWMELRPTVWDQYQQALSTAWNDVQTQSGLRARWEDACRGETGIECFDTWAHELVTTGYLHNHARMWFASIWIITLELPWVLGADFFLRYLLDGDPAANTLSWRWVAGIQTPGKNYLARTSNITRFTEGRFHPKWQLACEAPALPAPPVPAPRALPTPETATPEKRTGFLLHEEDLSPGYALEKVHPVVCGVLAPQMVIGPLRCAPHVAEFRAAAQKDAIARWGDRMGPVTHLADAQAVLAWATASKLEQIVTPYATTGPTASTLAALARHPDAPILFRVIRGYDRMTWPYATKSFFPFKKNIPEFIFNLRGNRAA